MTLVPVNSFALRLPAVAHLAVADTDATILGNALGDTTSATVGIRLCILLDPLLNELPLLVERRLAECVPHLVLKPSPERSDLAEELFEANFTGFRVIP